MRGYIYYKEKSDYPQDYYCRPDKKYPEYQYSKDGFSEKNEVYEMIRNMFIGLGLDKENIGLSSWNPLSEYIKEGDTVLIKPNLVNHVNEHVAGKRGLECLVTHPSVCRCIIDYVIIALKGTGKIIVADAPVQSCEFEKIKSRMGYDKIEEFYRRNKIEIIFEDLRISKCVKKDGHLYEKKNNTHYAGKIVNLGKKSYFYTQQRKLRITNYDFRVVNNHHKGKKQEYYVSEACLEADVIINLPKPKTHRKAGVTGALKNMIGINTSKDFLPHHTKGDFKSKKGDEYYHTSFISSLKSDLNDIIDILEKKSMRKTSDVLKKMLNILNKNSRSNEKYSEGSWWGNDTIWRTVLDVNLIVKYADKAGKMCSLPQRRIISIGDMIVSGEKEGPLLPEPIKTGTIIFSDNCVLFDKILVKYMGFDDKKIKVLTNAELNKKFIKRKLDDFYVQSNIKSYNVKLKDFKSQYRFEPSSGWKGYIEDRKE